jgi:hypothetical protein
VAGRAERRVVDPGGQEPLACGVRWGVNGFSGPGSGIALPCGTSLRRTGRGRGMGEGHRLARSGADSRSLRDDGERDDRR